VLPESNRQHYRDFQHALQQLLGLIVRANPDGSSLQAAFLEAQQLFQLRIMALETDELDSRVVSKVRSYITEINKQMRLLGMDVMFLQTARQSGKIQQRQAQMGDRIDTVLRYCQALLEAGD
jgi:hypothetical protein